MIRRNFQLTLSLICVFVSQITGFAQGNDPLWDKGRILLEQANTCSVDSDCVRAANVPCTLGCDVWVNRNADLSAAQNIFKKFRPWPVCESCLPSQRSCRQNKCVGSYVDQSSGQRMLISTDKSEYTLEEKIKITLQNNFSQDIWVQTLCEMPFSRLIRKDAAGEHIVGTGPISCMSPVYKISPSQKLVSMIDLAPYYLHVEPGTYKFITEYTLSDPMDNSVVGAGKQIIFEQSSNEFVIGAQDAKVAEDSQKNGTQRGGIIEDR